MTRWGPLPSSSTGCRTRGSTCNACADANPENATLLRFEPDGTGRTVFAKVLEYQAHSAPMSLSFYTGTLFPAEFRGNAFVAMRGSWNRNPPTGYKVVRVRFDAQGTPTAFEDFASGWLGADGTTQFARLADTAVAADGALLVTDDANGVIYRIGYSG